MKSVPEINILPKHIAELIAAGEVVERPASIVKEIMENSIDAGATKITLEIQRGGITYIRITDNGCGMTEDELENNLGVIASSGSYKFRQETADKDTADIDIIDYGIYYSNKSYEDYSKLEYDSDDYALIDGKRAAKKYSFEASDSAHRNGDTLDRVYQNYVFNFTGVTETQYRYGQLYLTFRVGGEDGKTYTVISDVASLCIRDKLGN